MKSYINKALKRGPRIIEEFVRRSYKTVFGYGHKYYSQNGEDIIISSFFKNKKSGFYIDIGSHHPMRYSNTYLLYKKGWQGINIDANPETIKLFNKYRPKDTNINIGVGDKTSKLTYHKFSDSAVNTFSKIEANKWKQSSWNTYLGSMDIDVDTAKNILEPYLETQVVDLLSVDVEGFDLLVLQKYDWINHSPQLVVIEDTDFSFGEPGKSEIYNFMAEKNYRLHSVVKFSLIFVKK